MSLTGGDTNGRARAARRALAVAIVGCGVLGLQSLPTASAAKGGATSTVTSASDGSAAATRRAERAAAKAEAAPPAQSPAPPAAEAPKAAGPDAGAGAGAAPRKGGAAAAAHAQRREERREARRSSSSTSTATSTTSTAASGTGVKPAVTSASGESSAGQAEALARKQKKGSGGGQKGKKEHKGKKAPQEEGSGSEEGSGTEGTGSEGASAPSAKPKGELVTADVAAQASAAAASLALPTAAPAAGTAPASVSSVTPAVNAASGGGVNADKAKRRAHKRSSATGAAATFSASPLLATQSSGAAAPATHAKRTAAKPSRQSSQPALVKTFTKIVGVVPTPVRILIGALILLALMLGVRSLLSGVRTRRLVRQRGQLLEDVGLLQAALLPEPPARLGPVATSAAYRPADGPGAGGDFYDVFALDGGEIAVIVGDVSGHGREALPHTALVRFTVRAYLEAGLSPRKALQTAGNVLDRQLAGSFATVIAATYNPRERKLTYASAGHPPPVMLGEQGDGAEAFAADAAGERSARALEFVTSCSAPPIGAGMPTGTRQTVVSVAGPTRLCFHTDGVTEARIDEELFGAERLAAALSDLDRDAGASALLDRITELSDARPDDMAACLLRVHDGQGSPAIALEQLELSRELLAGGRVVRFLLDCGVELGQAESILDDARRRLQRTDRVMLELVPGAGGPPIVSLIDDNVIRAAALAAPGASQAAMTR